MPTMPPPRRVVVGAAGAVLLCGFDGPGAAGHVPKWSTIYGFDVETNGTGTTGFTNLLWDANLTALGEAVARFPTNKAMWSPVATCVPNKTKVYGEPYCGGETGLWRGPSGVEWQVGADYWVAQVKDKPWVTGMWLGVCLPLSALPSPPSALPFLDILCSGTDTLRSRRMSLKSQGCLTTTCVSSFFI